MRFNEFKKLNEAGEDRVIAAVEFTDGTRITIRNIPRAATQSSNFESQIRARASRARPNLSFSRWSLVDDSQADQTDSTPERTYTPTAEEERAMQNVQALWDHLRSRSKASTPFTFTDSQGNEETIENPAEMLDSEAAWNGSLSDKDNLKEKIIVILKADDNITTVGPAQPRQTPGEPLRIVVAGTRFQYVRAIVYNTGDQ
jgi:hypothetical protein